MDIQNLQYNLPIEGETTKWTLKAKYFPSSKEFRVYSIYGDITKIDELVSGIRTFLENEGVPSGTITLTL